VKAVQIEDEDVLDLGLGRSIYSKAQVEEFEVSGLPRDPACLPDGDCRTGL
jgi:hypothetical protein